MMNADQLIADLRSAANALAETDRPEQEEQQIRLDKTGNVLCRMRNALQAIAKNQGGMPSHVAQQALLDCGYCAHFNSHSVDVTRMGSDPERMYMCDDCLKTEPERFESWT